MELYGIVVSNESMYNCLCSLNIEVWTERKRNHVHWPRERSEYLIHVSRVQQCVVKTGGCRYTCCHDNRYLLLQLLPWQRILAYTTLSEWEGLCIVRTLKPFIHSGSIQLHTSNKHRSQWRHFCIVCYLFVGSFTKLGCITKQY